MPENPILSPDPSKRVAGIAARTGRTRAEIVADALENGHPLAWQEAFLARVAEGPAAGDVGVFADAEDIERLRRGFAPS